MTTLHDIAKRANVSYMTVARVLSRHNKENRPSSIARAKRIRRVAQEMGYRPNAAARAITLGKFNNIALILHRVDITSRSSVSWISEIEESLANRKCRLTLNHISANSIPDDTRQNHLLGEVFADGMLVDCTYQIPPMLAQLLQKHTTPTIWLNTLQQYDSVRPDDFQGGILATEYLLAKGHRRIAYMDVQNHPDSITEGTAHYSARDRHAGYLEAMKNAGLNPQSFFTKKVRSVLPPGDLPTEEIFASDGPTAVISYGHECLIRLHTLAQTQNKSIQIVTFGETERTLCGEIPVDTVLIPTAQLGLTAVDMLFQKISRPEQILPSIMIPYERVASLQVEKSADGSAATARSVATCIVPPRTEPRPIHPEATLIVDQRPTLRPAGRYQ